MMLVASPAHGAPTRLQDTAPAIEIPAEGETQELILRDGTRAVGRVERVEDGRVTFRTVSGAIIEVEAAQITSVGSVPDLPGNRESWSPDPNPTRLFFAPTGRSLARGTAYFGVYEILLPFVQVGITDRISFGGGTPLVFGDGSEHPFWITPKIQLLDQQSTQVAAGVMHFINVGDGTLGIAYGVATYGNSNSAFTAGAGYAYARSNGASGGAGVLMFGGEHRATRRIKLISENYAWGGGGVAMGGIRLLSDRLSADMGMVVPIGADSFFAFPMINFVWKFGAN
jgi:hypothetical protein